MYINEKYLTNRISCIYKKWGKIKRVLTENNVNTL